LRTKLCASSALPWRNRNERTAPDSNSARSQSCDELWDADSTICALRCVISSMCCTACAIWSRPLLCSAVPVLLA